MVAFDTDKYYNSVTHPTSTQPDRRRVRIITEENHTSALNFLKEVNDSTLEIASSLVFDKELQADGLVVCLYGRLLELSNTIAVLIETERYAGVYSIFRSFLEAYVHFRNLNSDASYYLEIVAPNEERWVKVLRSSSDGNPFLETIANEVEIEKVLAEKLVRIEQYKADGYKGLNIYDRFKLAGMENEYKSIYRMNSGDVHNDFSAMVRHHLEQEGEDFRLSFFKTREVNEFDALLDSTIEVLVKASSDIHHRLNSEKLETIQDIEKRFFVLRQEK